MKSILKQVVFSGGLGVFAFLALPALAHAATLAVSPATQTATVGSTLTVNIVVDTAGQSAYGVDVNSLHYDPTALQVQDADAVTAGVQISAGTLMPNTTYNTVDTTNGLIKFSQVSNITGTNFTGVGTLATINFTVLKAGSTTLTFDYTAGSTTDCNVAGLYTDLLSGVTNGSYTLNNTTDTTAPTVPAGLTASSTSATSIGLSWTASTDPTVAGQTTSGVAGYKIFRGGVQIATSTLTSYTDTGLTPATAYTYTVAAYDNAGNTSAQSTSAGATTGANPDTTAPTTPTNLATSPVSTSAISLSWSASTDPTVAGQTTSGVAGYKVYRNSVQIGTSAGTAYNDTGLSAGTTYNYTVAAYDNAGNTSAQTAAAPGTTQSNPDVTAPTVTITSPTAGASVSGTISVAATASDPIVAGQVTSGVSLITVTLDGTVYATSSGTSLSKSLDTTILTNASHTLVATAKDNAGNTSTTATVTFTVFNLSTATRYPRKLVISSLEGLSSVPNTTAMTATVLSAATVLETQSNLLPNTSSEYTVTFLSTDPQLVDIRVLVTGYLTNKLTSIDTTVNSATDLTVPQLAAGDFNGDDTINSLDYSVLNAHYNQNFAAADINRDGLINSLDYAILKNNYGKTGQ